MNKWLTGVVIILAVFITTYLATVDTKISEYLPKNNEEKEINSVLVKFMETRNNFDVDGFLSVFHPDARYMIHPEFMASKEELRAMLPGLWRDGCDGCITWECINEHCYKSSTIVNPEISVDHERAKVLLIIRAGFYRGKLYIDLVKQNNRWSIMRLARPLN